MGKKTYFINGHYYIVDDETGEIKEVIIKEGINIPDDIKQLIKMILLDRDKT